MRPNHLPDLLLHSLPIPHQTVITELVHLLPVLPWEPQCPGQERRMACIEEGETRNTVPCLLVDGVARFVQGRDGIVGEIEVDEIVAA